MRVILDAMGRAFLRDFIITFVTFAGGILSAPNYREASSLAVAGSLAALVSAVRGVRVFVPQISTGIAKMIHVKLAYAEVLLTAITTFLVGFIALAEGVLSAPDFGAAHAALVAGGLAIGTSLVRVLQAWLTPGEGGDGGIKTPPQPVPAAALPTPIPEPVTK